MSAEKEKEAVCRRCGRCCYAKVILEDEGTGAEATARTEVVYTPFPCPYLDEKTRLCTIYQNRHEINPKCLSLDEGIERGIFPADCPYVADIKDYVPPREDWTQQDLGYYAECGDAGDSVLAAGHRGEAMKTLVGRFLEVVERRAGHAAVADPTTSLTYEELSRHAFAGAAAVAGSTERPFVGVAMPPCAMFPPAFFGVLLAGRTPLPLNFLQEPATLAAIVADAELDTILTLPPLRGQMLKLVRNVLCPEEIARAAGGGVAGSALRLHPMKPGDVATLLYTSGTVGPPKGVMLTHRNLMANVDSAVQMADYTQDDVSLGVLPLFHTFGITCTMLLPLLVGAKVVYLPRFSPAAALKLIGGHGVTCAFAVPSLYRVLVGAARGLPDAASCAATLRFCVSGGEALGREVADGFQKVFGKPLLEGYGLTETSPVVCLNPPDALRPGSVGLPLSWADVRIADPAGNALPVGEPGELLVHGECVMKGYYRRPEETDQAFTGDGWLRTGDLAKVDADGYLYVTGRLKEMIVSAGENISPGEIETVLGSHPAVSECAVAAMPDASRGEVPRAFVVLKPGARASEGDLIEHCRGALARAKVPRKVEFRPELPHTLTGKILKRALR